MSNVRFLELTQYTIPKPTEVRGKDWVEYGDNNDFYQQLIDARQSATHNAMINGITELLYGKGLSSVEASRKPEEWANAVSLFTQDALRCLMEDYYIFGDGYLQCIWNQDHSKIVEVQHMPTINIRPEKCNAEGEIEGYYYHDKWEDMDPKDKPKRIPALGTSKEGLEVFRFKGYTSGYYYFTPPAYISGLPYCDIEVEVANYHLNNILNGFAARHILNLNNGVPEDDEKDAIERKINEKFAGSSNAGRMVIAFNDGAENAATLESVPLNDAHNQYEFIAKEATRKILVSHRVTSPILVGLKDEGSSMGNNADEIMRASQLFDNTVIKPMQRVIIEGLQHILSYNDVSIEMYFKTSQPLDFTEVENDEVSDEEKQEQTGIELSKEAAEALDNVNLSEFGEESLDGWVCVYEGEAGDHETEDEIDEMVRTANEAAAKKPETLLSRVKGMLNLASTGTARPNARSEWDDRTADAQFKVLYEYSPNKVSADSREFCRKMVSASKLYRREDIERMSNSVVNAGWGPRGANTYDIFLYKGGGGCHHRWTRKVYMRKDAQGNIDVKSPIANRLVTSIREAQSNGYSKGIDPDYNKAKTRPKDMPNKGFLNPR